MTIETQDDVVALKRIGKIVSYVLQEMLDAAEPAPALLHDGHLVTESGAITDYIIRTYGKGRMMPKPGTADHEKYLEWLHFAEGSAIHGLQLLGRVGAHAIVLNRRPRRRLSR